MASSSTHKAPRQRFHRTDPEEVEPVDEDLQNKIVSDIANRIATQQVKIQGLLSVVCRMSSVVSFGITIVSNMDTKKRDDVVSSDSRTSLLAWIFGGCMAVVLWKTPQWIPIQTAESPKPNTAAPSSLPFRVSYYPTLTLLAWVVAAVLLWKERMRYSLVVASILALHFLCVGAAMYVQSDHRASRKLLEDVAAAKYRYKSL